MSTKPTLANHAAALRQVAELLVEHPDLPRPYVTMFSDARHAEVHWYLHINDRGDLETQKKAAQKIIRDLGGTWDKDPRDDGMFLHREHGLLKLEVAVKREAVCERIVTGTETVTVPAVEAQPERIETREVVEWVCAEPILKAVGA